MGDGKPMDLLGLFRDTVSDVPAYRKFLLARDVDPDAVVSVDQIPLTSKSDYHHRYPLPERCRGGRVTGGDIVALSSGSSGTPTVWPRSARDERGGAARMAHILRDAFHADERTTLAVVCFALGHWVGGMYVAGICRRLAAEGYPITVAPAGNDIDEVLRVVDELGGHYEQVVLLGYPPFVKNVIDSGLARGVDWAAYRIKIVMAGEVISEQWRDLIGLRAGMTDPASDVANMYGTADGGVLATETPLSVRIRRFLAGRPDLASAVFGDSRLPTLAQFDPATHLFETVPGGTLAFSTDGTVPLIRYHIADEGGLIGYDDLIALCRGHGFDPGDGADLPFVFVFGRSMFTVSFFGANVYPEDVAVALEQPGIADWATGRFVLRTLEDVDRDRRLNVVVEVAGGASGTETRRRAAAEAIRAELLRVNNEFAHYVPAGYQTPDVELRAADDPEFFPPGIKHRYSRPDPSR
ncbi:MULTISPECIES: phenylacetate--CoA ligase family protein [Catenuloplanes]|uniref:Phenylacetate-CoA ligase n=1 Tax=Catenuloplanes niger TaxID=587534 RepID=A0AAE3ZKM1_9ACTN|nr:phenylacetate--CoA ligase family protein [Catenuloplanes niger]MDR7320687.1 phenylacetate-CoA ligase [Catenuloplanes niger]